MTEEGFIEVGVEPSTKGAAATFQRELDALEKRLDPVDVELAAKLAKGFAQDARREAQRVLARVHADLNLTPKAAKGFAQKARAEVQKAVAKVTADVAIRAKVDNKEIRAQAQKAVKQVETVKAHVDVRFNADEKNAIGVVNTALRKAQAQAGKIQIKFEVTPQGLNSLLTDVKRAMGNAQTAAWARPIDVRFDVDPTDLIFDVGTAMTAAQAEAWTSPIDVRFDVDPTDLIAQVTGATLAAQAAAPNVNVTSSAGGAAAVAAGGAGAGMGRGLMMGGAAMLPGAAMAGLFATSIDEASSLSEALSKTQAVYGEYAGEIIKWSEGSSAALGQAQAESLAAVGTMGNLMQAFGVDRVAAKDMSITLTQLASDLASFNDTSTEDALIAITSGLSGETEPLKRFGVALSDVRLKEAALSAGLIKNTKGALDPHTKALAAYQLIMEDTALAQGDFVRNGDGYANLSRTVASEFTNLKAAIGEPMQAGLLAILPTIIDAVREMTPMLVDLSGEFAGTLGPAIQQFLPLIQPLVYMFGMLFSSVVRVAGAVAEFLTPIVVPVLARLGDTIGIIASVMSDKMDTILKFAAVLGALFLAFKIGSFVATIGPLIAGAISAVGGAITGLGAFLVANPVGLAFVAIAAGLMAAYQWCEPFREAITEIWVVLKDNLMPIFDGITGMVMSLFDGGINSGEFIGSLENVKQALSNIWDVLPGALARAGDALVTWATDTLVPALLSAGKAFLDWGSRTVLPALGSVGGAIIDWVLNTLVPMIASVGSKVWGWVKDTLPDLITTLSALRSKLVAWLLGPFLKTVVSGIGKILGTVLKWIFTDGLKMLGQIGKWLLTDALPFLLKIFGQLVLSGAALIGQIFMIGIDYLWQGLQLLGPWLIGTALPWLGEKIVALVKGALSLWADIGSWMLEWFVAGFVFLALALPTAFVAIWNWFADLPEHLKSAWESIKNLGSLLWDWIKGAFDWMREKLPEAWDATKQWFKDLPQNAKDAIGDLSETLVDKGKELMSGFWNGLKSLASDGKDFAGGVVNSIIGFVNDKIIGAINSGIAKVWPGFLGDAPQVGLIPELANGGLITEPTLAVVGEAGPELVLPLTRPDRMAELLGEAGIADAVKSAYPNAGAAAMSLPDLAPVETWTAEMVGLVVAVPSTIQAQQTPKMVRWASATSTALAGQSSMWETWATSTTARTVATWETGMQRMVTATVTAGQKIASSMEGAINTSTPRLVLAVQGYATALTGALNPVLTAIGSDPIVLKFAEGGSVPGPRVNRDIVPALLMPGEVVIRRSSVDAFGAKNLLDLNAGRVPSGWQIPRFAEGGMAAPLSGDAMERATSYADRAVGKPYVWGGVGPNGFDCSGLWSGIISAVRDQTPRRLFTSSSIMTEARKIGMLPGLGQISVGSVRGNPGHVGGTIAGTNYEATPPRVLKGAAARGANHPMFTHRFHVGSGFWLEPGQSIDLPKVPTLVGDGALSSTATALMDHAAGGAARFVDANTFASPTNLGDLVEAATGNASAANARGWLSAAIRATGVPMSWLPGLMTIAQRESAFNPRAINNWDSNARKGVPSKGLMQTIDPTFRAYALPGHGDIWNPVDNAIAAIRYIQARYGDIGRVQQANPNMAPRGYAVGGLVTPGGGRATGSGMSSSDVDRLIEAIGSIPGGQTFQLGTNATTTDGQAKALLHRLAALLA